ncbi:hypothetical protein L6310_24450 (plasmid) [Citrobacter portucalensis]|nr:hypothetical protein L6310_24450 [Citrobacter portucalensis]
MIIPGLVALIYRDGAGRAFTFFVALAIGSMLWWPNRKEKGELKSREGFLIVVLFWTVLRQCGALPFIFAESPNLTITDAFFESFSGLTTTGATTLVGWIHCHTRFSFIARCCNGSVGWGSSCWRWLSCLFLVLVGCSSIVQKCRGR